MRFIGLSGKAFQMFGLIISRDIPKAKRLIFAFLNKTRIRSLFGSDKLIETGGGFGFGKWVTVSLELAGNKALAYDGIGAVVGVKHWMMG